MEYVSSPNKGKNIFLEKSKSKNDRENLVLYRGLKSFILMNLYPYNNGHIMIAPYEQYNDITDLDTDILFEIMELTQKSIVILKNKLNSEGFNFGLNMGKAAGAGIDEHLHFHIVPRWIGDSNFMPIVGQTEVIVQGLYDTYDLLKPEFNLL
jgi:ATP adenylyltransferase